MPVSPSTMELQNIRRLAVFNRKLKPRAHEGHRRCCAQSVSLRPARKRPTLLPMSLSRACLDLAALPLKLRRQHQPRRHPDDPRILVIRRNRMGDMIYTLPLLHALRRHFPQAHLTVACDPLGAPIAQACPAVNDVIVLEPGWNPWQAAFKNAARLQNYDWVIAAKGGFDRRLAVLTRLTNAAIRIGFERPADRPSAYYTDPVALPGEPHEEHQVDTLLRLLKPVGLVKPTGFTVDLSLRLPDSAREFAAEILARPPFALVPPFHADQSQQHRRAQISRGGFHRAGGARPRLDRFRHRFGCRSGRSAESR